MEIAADVGRGARKKLADEHHADDSTIKNWISEATLRGFWSTRGSGKTGQPTARAYETIKEARS